MNRQERRSKHNRRMNVYLPENDDFLNKLVELGLIKKWVRVVDSLSFNVLLNNDVVLNVPDEYFNDWFLNIIDQERGALVLAANVDGMHPRVAEIQAELDIYRGVVPTPANYQADPQRVKGLMAELKQLLEEAARR